MPLSINSSVVKNFFKRFQLNTKLSTSPNNLELIYKTFMNIPYENATKIINYRAKKAQMRLPEELFSEYLSSGTGGTCFSLVYALQSLLSHLGFSAQLVLADRPYGSDTHAAVVATVGDYYYLLDPGYLVPEPIKLPRTGENTTQKLPMNKLFIENSLSKIKISTIRNEQKKFRYAIKKSDVSWNIFSYAWKNSFEFKMMNDLFITKTTKDSQLYLRNNRLELITKSSRLVKYINNNYSLEIEKIFGISKNIVNETLRCQSLKK